MLAIDRPFITSSSVTDVETCGNVCLEYGSGTQLYLVPFVRQGEQVHFFFCFWSFTAQYILSETEA